MTTVRIIEPQAEFKDGPSAELENGDGSSESELEANSERFFRGQMSERGPVAEGIHRDGDSPDSSSAPQTSERPSDAIYL